MWGSDIDPGAIAQAHKTAQVPILAGPVAIMPDAHVGIGATVGTVIVTQDAIIPAAVGVDIGCGMIAVKLDLFRHAMPLDLHPLLKEFAQSVPAGMNQNHTKASDKATTWLMKNPPPSELPVSDDLVTRQLGTLGSGNHFIEVCVDEQERVWVVLHSGSRGVGNKLANKYISLTKRANKEKLPDPDLAWLESGQPLFDEYLGFMLWAQNYALTNREFMMDAVLAQLSYFIGRDGRDLPEISRINCHHNFAQEETIHGWDDVILHRAWVTRKGAIASYRNQAGVIPGSMGTSTYITAGVGNLLSYCSSSHGAGRRLSRGQAKRTLSLDSLHTKMEGRAWNSDKASSLLDEHPDAYKDIHQVMRDQEDLTVPIAQLTAILNYKGA